MQPGWLTATMGLRGTDLPGRFVAEADDGTLLATLTLTRTNPGDPISVIVEPARGALVRLEDARALVDAIDALADAVRDPIACAVHDELGRDEARRRGWTGPLRGPLTPSPGPTDGTTVAERVGALLPGTQVSRHRTLSRHAVTLDISVPYDRVVRVRVPARDDVMAESVAAAVDTMLAVRRRFGQRAGVTKLDFDPGGAGFAGGSIVGTAEGATGVAVLNPTMILASELAANRLQLDTTGSVRISAPVPPPWFPVDGVTAHECWHFMDRAITTSPEHYTELHRALGASLGVESFELALRGSEHGAPPAWQRAHERLVREVSPYAATSPREATAELFVRWWFGPPGASTVVDTFGALVDRWLPPG
jgi:hypothetical protein